MHCKSFSLPLGLLVGLVLVSQLGQDVNAIDLVPRYKHQQLARSDATDAHVAHPDKKKDKKHKDKGKDKPQPQPADPSVNSGVCYQDNSICTAGNGDIIHPGYPYSCKSVWINTDTAMVCNDCSPNNVKKDCNTIPHGTCVKPTSDSGNVEGCFVQF